MYNKINIKIYKYVSKYIYIPGVHLLSTWYIESCQNTVYEWLIIYIYYASIKTVFTRDYPKKKTLVVYYSCRRNIIFNEKLWIKWSRNNVHEVRV